MSKVRFRILSLLLAVLLTASVLASCTGGKEAGSAQSSTAANVTGASSEGTSENGTQSSRITDKDITLTYWTELNEKAAASISNYGEAPIYKEMEKRTGVKIKFIHPPMGSDQELQQFNLMVAANELPDIIEFNITNSYPGGPEKAISDNVILRLNDIFKENAPNLSKYLSEHPAIDKMVKTDGGSYYVFPLVQSDLVWCGPMLRKDWLDELGLEVPTTIDEWTNVLRQFKDKKGATAPFSYLDWLFDSAPAFIGAYGVCYGYNYSFYQDDGKVKYAPIQPGYKEFLKLFSQWYAEGLLDPDFAGQDGNTYDAKITSGKTGAFIGALGGGMAKYIQLMEKENPEFKLTGAPYPTLKKGDTPEFSQLNFEFEGYGSAAITTKCKEPEIAAKWLDYAYGEEGSLLYNWGIENESYVIKDGKPVYTDLILKNPNGLSIVNALALYGRATTSGPIVVDARTGDASRPYKEQIEAKNMFSAANPIHRIPPITPTPEESSTFAQIMSQIKTYTGEMHYKFIMGQESLDNFDKYVQNVKAMDIDKATEIWQSALDRYNSR